MNHRGRPVAAWTSLTDLPIGQIRPDNRVTLALRAADQGSTVSQGQHFGVDDRDATRRHQRD